jgi:hypothetical protein
MFRCQYCQSHIFTNSTTIGWTDLIGQTVCERAYEKTHLPNQTPEFYVTNNTGEVVYATEHFGLVRVGNMRFWLPDDSHITTTEQLKQHRITTDIALEMAIKNDAMRIVGSPVFEVRLESNPNIRVQFSTLNEAIKYMNVQERDRNPSHISYAIDEVMESLKPWEMR